MTIVESFEKAPIENMISVLAARPEKVIFLGDAAQMRGPVQKYREILKKKQRARPSCLTTRTRPNLNRQAIFFLQTTKNILLKTSS